MGTIKMAKKQVDESLIAQKKGLEEDKGINWAGLAALLAGMLIMGALGVVSIWGNLVIYMTSKFRGSNLDLHETVALIVFPLTFAVGSVGMQLGSYLEDKISPKLQALIGGVIFCPAIYFGQVPETFTAFVLIYAVVAGIGFGIVYFLTLGCAWSHFDDSKRDVIAGTILCCFSLNALAMSFVCTGIVNPDNEAANIIDKHGKNFELYFAPDSTQVQNLN